MTARPDPRVYDSTHWVLTNLPLLARRERLARGVTQREACRQSGVSNATWSKMENGYAGLSHGVTMALLGWLRADPNDR